MYRYTIHGFYGLINYAEKEQMSPKKGPSQKEMNQLWGRVLVVKLQSCVLCFYPTFGEIYISKLDHHIMFQFIYSFEHPPKKRQLNKHTQWFCQQILPSIKELCILLGCDSLCHPTFFPPFSGGVFCHCTSAFPVDSWWVQMLDPDSWGYV